MKESVKFHLGGGTLQKLEHLNFIYKCNFFFKSTTLGMYNLRE